jgi:hypothetical protein
MISALINRGTKTPLPVLCSQQVVVLLLEMLFAATHMTIYLTSKVNPASPVDPCSGTWGISNSSGNFAVIFATV